MMSMGPSILRVYSTCVMQRITTTPLGYRAFAAAGQQLGHSLL